MWDVIIHTCNSGDRGRKIKSSRLSLATSSFIANMKDVRLSLKIGRDRLEIEETVYNWKYTQWEKCMFF